jgi:hypothetical protein
MIQTLRIHRETDGRRLRDAAFRSSGQNPDYRPFLDTAAGALEWLDVPRVKRAAWFLRGDVLPMPLEEFTGERDVETWCRQHGFGVEWT